MHHLQKDISTDAIPPKVQDGLSNSLFDASLLSIRVINDFFRQDGFPTDIKAYHYRGYQAAKPFLTETGRGTINKHLAHLTAERASMSQGWPAYDMVIQCYQASETFLSYLISPDGEPFRPDDVDIRSRIRIATQIESLIRKALGK